MDALNVMSDKAIIDSMIEAYETVMQGPPMLDQKGNAMKAAYIIAHDALRSRILKKSLAQFKLDEKE